MTFEQRPGESEGINEPYGSGETLLLLEGAASAKALGSERVNTNIGWAALQGNEWPGWWKWFMGEV